MGVYGLDLYSLHTSMADAMEYLERSTPRPPTARERYACFEQFDAVLHVDETHAVEPLEVTSTWTAGELPETYPWGV